MTEKSERRREPTIGVGDRVVVQVGPERVEAEVLEDRGRLGPGGQRLLRLGWFPSKDEDRLEFEVPEGDVQPTGLSFEDSVRRILSRFAAEINDSPSPVERWRPDFLVSIPPRTIVAEARSARALGPKQLGDLERRLLRAMSAYKADEALLVVPKWTQHLQRRDKRPGVSVVPVGELEDWLATSAGKD